MTDVQVTNILHFPHCSWWHGTPLKNKKNPLVAFKKFIWKYDEKDVL